MTGPVTSGRRGVVTLLAVAALVAGVAIVAVGLLAQRSAPRPPRSVGRIDPVARTPTPGPSRTPGSTASPGGWPGHRGAFEPARTGPRPLPASRPVRIRIPSIGVSSVVDALGLSRDGSLAVPRPGPHLDQAAWFDASPTPGQPGPSVIEGHVDSELGPSVFFRLGAVRPGDHVLVTRRDRVVVVFEVDAVRDYPKSNFPTSVVYGGNLDRPQLRLITCSDFDTTTHHHTGDEVVFSHLVAVRHPHPKDVRTP